MVKVDPPSEGEIHDAAVAQVLRVLREFRTNRPDAEVYAAAYYMFYCDGSLLAWPMVAIGTQENLILDDGTVDEGIRWSPADWGYDVEANDAEQALAQRVHEYAVTLGSDDAYDEVYENRFFYLFPEAAKAAAKQAIAEGLVGEDFIVVPIEQDEVLLRLTLTEEQLQRHFPDLVEVNDLAAP